MKLLSGDKKRKRIISGVCALIIVVGGFGTYRIMHAKTGTDDRSALSDSDLTQTVKSTGSSDSISAGGTVASLQLCDYLGMESTNIRLKVDEVYAEAGDTVTAGTALYHVTQESLDKAKKTLETELQSAESSLLSQQMSYETDKNSAYALYQSELLLGDTVVSTLESGVNSLDTELQNAYSEYTEAVNTISSTPSQISAKQSELDSRQSEADSCSSQAESLQNEVNSAKSAYTSAADSYNSVIAEYNAAAGTVSFIGSYLGLDISDVQLKDRVSANIQESSGAPGVSSEGGMPSDGGSFSGGFSGGSGGFSGGMRNGTTAYNLTEDTSLYDLTEGEGQRPENEAPAETESNELMKLYESARSEYENLKNRLSETEQTYKNAESEYQSRQNSLNECNNKLKEAQNAVSSLTKEISSLNSRLSSAKSNLSGLLATYTNLKNSYDTDKLELQNTYDTDEAAYQNAEYHYKITLNTIEEKLETVQNAYNKASENLRIFNELLADGVIEAQQDGILYSLSYDSGSYVQVSSPLVYYVNEESFYTTVELNQYQVTEINIGDSVIIYSSETGTASGTITGISSGESTSLADVNFNVTVTADEGSGLYSGQSVNVYFNAGSGSTDFKDFQGGSSDEDGEGSRGGFSGNFSQSGGERPDFGGMDFSKMRGE